VKSEAGIAAKPSSLVHCFQRPGQACAEAQARQRFTEQGRASARNAKAGSAAERLLHPGQSENLLEQKGLPQWSGRQAVHCGLVWEERAGLQIGHARQKPGTAGAVGLGTAA